jgi:hypothetical protein
VKTLLAGWFSFEGMGATAGDLISRDLAQGWLRAAGHDVDVAHARPFTGGVDWRTVDAKRYETVVFVCGPMGNGPPVDEFLARFSRSRLVGLNLSMLDPVEAWNPFDLLIERDSTMHARPDIAFGADATLIPLVGVVLVHPQQEYGGGLHATANAAISRLLSESDIAAIAIDTRLDENAGLLTTAPAVESAIARMDAIVTTRLHGAVLAIKNAVPPLVIDPIAGGAKVAAQMRALGWTAAYTADSIDDEQLAAALRYCLSDAGRSDAAVCRDRAAAVVRGIRDGFLSELAVNVRV